MARKDPQNRQWRDTLLRQQGYPRQKGIEGGEALLSELQSEFLDWLIDPNRTGTQKAWAEAHGLHPLKPSDWKREDYFLRAWRTRAERLAGGPERLQVVAESLYQAAQQDWRAAAEYLKWAEKMSPPRKPVVETGDLRDMSDEDFRAKLTEFIKGATENGE